jgi:hypothetical protein
MSDLAGFEIPKRDFRHAATRREIAKSYKRQGLKNYEIAKILNVTPGHVSYMLNDKRRRRYLTNLREKERRADGKRRYVCGVCGERGHNALRHDRYSPEDIEWMKKH